MTSPRHMIAAVLAVLVVTTACARPSALPQPVGSPQPVPTERPSVTVERTGGFAGGTETTTVSADGAWVRAGHPGSPRSGRLTADQHRQLSQLVTDPRLPEEARRTPGQTNCRDAFNYRVVVGTTTVSYVDCPADRDLPEAAQAIVALVEAATAG